MADEETKTTKPDAEPVQKPAPVQRFVSFEIVPDGFKIVRNDCASVIEYQGLLLAALEYMKKK